MLAHLVPCPSCSRHVRVNAGACPFCQAALPAELVASPAPRPANLGKRGTRAAMILAGATALAACGGSSTSPPSTDAGGKGTEDAADTGVTAAYGAPGVPVEAGAEAGASEGGPGEAGQSEAGEGDAGEAPEAAMALYGGSPIEDGGSIGHDSGAIAAYGASPGTG